MRANNNIFIRIWNAIFGRNNSTIESNPAARQTQPRVANTIPPKRTSSYQPKSDTLSPPPKKVEKTEVVEKSPIQIQIPPNMRTINRIFIHSTATPEGRHHTIDEIRRWHTLPPPQGNGWRDIGYHYVIYLDGSIHTGRDISVAGAHVVNHNTGSIGIAYVGGTDASGRPKDTRTPEQRAALNALLSELQNEFPNATIHGHNEFAATACPSFNVQTEL